MFVPANQWYRLIDALCAGAERHRHPLSLATLPLLALAAATPPGGFLNLFGVASGTITASGGALGYVSRWRDWSE